MARGCHHQQDSTEGLARVALGAKFKTDTDELPKHFWGANKKIKQTKQPNQTIQGPIHATQGPCHLSSLGVFEKVLPHCLRWPWILDHPDTVFQELRLAELCYFESSIIGFPSNWESTCGHTEGGEAGGVMQASYLKLIATMSSVIFFSSFWCKRLLLSEIAYINF